MIGNNFEIWNFSFRLGIVWRHCWKDRAVQHKKVSWIFFLNLNFLTGGASADDISSLKRELSEARERTKKTESEKEDLKTKTEELERKVEEMTKERKDFEEKTKQAKAAETKKLLSAVTKLLLSSFPTDQVLN